jgi:hypothetical protein
VQDDDASPSRGLRSSPAGRAVGAALVVLALVAMVAVAATGSTSSGSDRSTTPADSVLDTVFSLVLVLFVVGFVFVVFALVRWREHEWTAPKRRNDIRALVGFVVVAFALALLLRDRDWRLPFSGGGTPLDRGEGSLPPPALQAGDDPGYDFDVAWLPVGVVIALAAIGVAAFVLSARRKRSSRVASALAADLATALDLTVDDLRAEADPRRAVIAAYARLERVLAAHGEPRRPADTPEEHLSRVLAHLAVDRRAIRRLEDLFLRAKFSQHAVDAEMKEQAIAALVDVRDDLRVGTEQEEMRETAEASA